MTEEMIKGFLFGMVVGVLLITTAAVFICVCENNKWQRDAIERGVAGYDATTGEWEWKVQPIKSGAKQ